MPSSQAAWLTAKGAPLTIGPTTVSDPTPNQILIKSRAVAINPVDWAMQAMGQDLFPWLKFPCTLGNDVAGEVISVGSNVTRVKVGDRVLGFAERAAFQEHAILAGNLFSPISNNMSFEEASVIPLCLSTSACALFQKDHLALPHPSVKPKPLGKTLLVWSGASSVGCNAIQLGVAAGCDVITTCSPKNYELVKKLGASQTFDYSSDTVVSDILAYLEDKTIAGAVGVSNLNAWRAGHGVIADNMLLEIVSKAKGNKFVATAQPYKGQVPEGVECKFILGSALATNEVGAVIYADYLPKALAEGKFIAAPEPLVVGKGLESIQKAFEVQMKGVSAKKVVVSL
ncbi:hypothetical protein N7G274_010892 [Stereocaulon virgatum]|uniref:Enoyl reductase (ER) domain-containing protein n=1 Tax=Stereocaulon virgatum TaxID=373712 RepID=A0ABR3ZV71_9LECA